MGIRMTSAWAVCVCVCVGMRVQFAAARRDRKVMHACQPSFSAQSRSIKMGAKSPLIRRMLLANSCVGRYRKWINHLHLLVIDGV